MMYTVAALLTALLLGAGVAPPPPPPPGPHSSDDECFKDGWAYPSGPPDLLRTESGVNNANKCQNKCKKESGCVGFNFEKSTKTCQMLKHLGPRGPKEEKPGWVSAPVDCEDVVSRETFVDVLMDNSASVALLAGGIASVTAAGALFYAVSSKKYASVAKEPLMGQIA